MVESFAFMKIFQKTKPSKNKNLSPFQTALVDFLTDVVIIFFLVLVIVKPFFFAPFRVQQESMTPNVLDGEFIIVWKTPYVFGKEYEHNDVIVFKPENSKHYLIKRVIGEPGETIRFFDGFVWMKNEEGEFKKLDESFLAPHNLGNTCVENIGCNNFEKSKKVDFEIPEDQYFVLGDNRKASRDSRSCFKTNCNGEDPTHFLAKDEIEGKAVATFARMWKEDGKKNFTIKNTRIISNPEVRN